jgi:DNA-nicking Smr family endonuclease
LAKIVLDLHEIYNKGFTIDAELNRVIAEAVEKKIALVEIIPGKGSGQLKKRVLRFLAQPEIKSQYHRLEKDDKNFGRIFLQSLDFFNLGKKVRFLHLCFISEV